MLGQWKNQNGRDREKGTLTHGRGTEKVTSLSAQPHHSPLRVTTPAHFENEDEAHRGSPSRGELNLSLDCTGCHCTPVAIDKYELEVRLPLERQSADQ